MAVGRSGCPGVNLCLRIKRLDYAAGINIRNQPFQAFYKSVSSDILLRVDVIKNAYVTSPQLDCVLSG